MDYSQAQNKLKEKEFSLISKRDQLNDFTCAFQKKDLIVTLKVQLGGYILSVEIKNKQTSIVLHNLESSLIFEIM
tara:strand:+ start:1822 stop:2046 length:225 start_codon:yes stop_codon:yes gene_type:complete